LFTALAVLWLLGGIAHGMGGGVLLKPFFEDAETSGKRALALVPVLAMAGLLALDYLVWMTVVLGIVPETASHFIGGRMIPHGPEDTIGESFILVGFAYLLLLLVAFVLTVASRRKAERGSDEPG